MGLCEAVGWGCAELLVVILGAEAATILFLPDHRHPWSRWLVQREPTVKNRLRLSFLTHLFSERFSPIPWIKNH